MALTSFNLFGCGRSGITFALKEEKKEGRKRERRKKKKVSTDTCSLSRDAPMAAKKRLFHAKPHNTRWKLRTLTLVDILDTAYF